MEGRKSFPQRPRLHVLLRAELRVRVRRGPARRVFSTAREGPEVGVGVARGGCVGASRARRRGQHQSHAGLLASSRGCRVGRDHRHLVRGSRVGATHPSRRRAAKTRFGDARQRRRRRVRIDEVATRARGSGTDDAPSGDGEGDGEREVDDGEREVDDGDREIVEIAARRPVASEPGDVEPDAPDLRRRSRRCGDDVDGEKARGDFDERSVAIDVPRLRRAKTKIRSMYITRRVRAREPFFPRRPRAPPRVALGSSLSSPLSFHTSARPTSSSRAAAGSRTASVDAVLLRPRAPPPSEQILQRVHLIRRQRGERVGEHGLSRIPRRRSRAQSRARTSPSAAERRRRSPRGRRSGSTPSSAGVSSDGAPRTAQTVPGARRNARTAPRPRAWPAR